MSRSYRHFPCVSYIRRGFKRIANKRVRRVKELGDYKYYRKVFPTYDICDRKSIFTINDFLNNYVSYFKAWGQNQYSSRPSLYYYYKTYKWK